MGLIPAAGMGTRLGAPWPKELAPITYRDDHMITVLDAAVHQLATAGVTEAVIVLRPIKEVIRHYLGYQREGVRLNYIQQSSRRSKEGLPDAIGDARPLLREADLIVMLMGDVYFTDPLVTQTLVEAMTAHPETPIGVSVWNTATPERFGIVSVQEGMVKAVVDKPQGLTTGQFWGAVAFRPAFWPYILNETFTLSAALHSAAPVGIRVVEAAGNYLDLGTPQSLIQGILEINR